MAPIPAPVSRVSNEPRQEDQVHGSSRPRSWDTYLHVIDTPPEPNWRKPNTPNTFYDLSGEGGDRHRRRDRRKSNTSSTYRRLCTSMQYSPSEYGEMSGYKTYLSIWQDRCTYK
ncbi:hypothetical protein M758_UG201300 [Ceratodon purpureus]|nr:hypothetical protein M758_UG201300 [Ceratodon purpureus]